MFHDSESLCWLPSHFLGLASGCEREGGENGKKQLWRATGCTWPWEGWLAESRKWREKERKEIFLITAVFRSKKTKNPVCRPRGTLCCFFLGPIKGQECLCWFFSYLWWLNSDCFCFAHNNIFTHILSFQVFPLPPPKINPWRLKSWILNIFKPVKNCEMFDIDTRLRFIWVLFRLYITTKQLMRHSIFN